MFTKLGIISLLAGIFVWIFSIISGFMRADNIWAGITLSVLTGDQTDKILDAVSNEMLHDVISTLFYDLPLGGVIIGLGVIFLCISFFKKEH